MNKSIITIFLIAVTGGAVGALTVIFSLTIYEKILAKAQKWRFGKSPNSISVRKKYDQQEAE